MSKKSKKCKPFAWGYNNYGQLGYPTFRDTFVNVCNIDDIIQVDGGDAHSLALRSDGRVFAWGDNSQGQLGINSRVDRDVPTELVRISDVTFISAGFFHSLAVKSDGTAFAWGDNSNGQLGDGTFADSDIPVQVDGLTDIVAVAGGSNHSLALDSNGNVFGWGSNDSGQLGRGFFGGLFPTAAPVMGLTDVIAIAAGNSFSLALKNDGTVFAWGANFNGQLGDGTQAFRNAPVQVNTITNIIAITAGDSHSLALESNGTLWSWGLNSNGQLGDGTREDRRLSPVTVVDITDIALMQLGAIAAGGNHSMALLNDGTVRTWGENDLGQLGDGIGVDSNRPVEVICLKGAIFVGAGFDHSLAIKNDGTVWAWGDNFLGQLGSGEFGEFSTIPVKVRGIEGVTDIACGEFHNLALKSDRKIRAWGDNTLGQLGDGTFGGGRDVPVMVVGIDCVEAISGGENHSIALREGGKVFAWGDNSEGQLGDGTLINRAIPGEVIGLPRIIAIAACGGFSLALTCEGKVFAWGDNEFGQLGDGTTVNRIVPVMVEDLEDIVAIGCGDNHSLAVRKDGILFAWGDNEGGQLGIGSFGGISTTPVQVLNISNVKEASGGVEHSLALTCDGRVFAWGSNSSGQLGNGTFIDSNVPVRVFSIDNAVQIAAGGSHNLALKKNCFKVFAWGDNRFGQLGDGTLENSNIPVKVDIIRDVIDICAGEFHSLAINCNIRPIKLDQCTKCPIIDSKVDPCFEPCSNTD